MQPSDFLTILGLAIAVWSIIPSKERNFILLFFSRLNFVQFISSLLIIHFLMSFDWLQQYWFSWLSIFTTNNGIPAATWAYILALLTIAIPILKVTKGYYSESRLEDLLTLYKKLLNKNDIDILVEYIEKYHIMDIQIFLIGKSNLIKSGEPSLKRTNAYRDDLKKIIKPQKINFAYHVYKVILKNENFIKNAANKHPELFSTAFYGIQSENASDKDAVNLFIQILFENKNQAFINELKIADQAYDSILDRTEFNDMPILSSLFIHTKAAFGNHIWFPIAEGAVKSLKNDINQKEFLEKEYDYMLEPELWNYKIWIATVYFNYMVRETIYRENGWHMWLFYFRSATELLIENIPSENRYQPDEEYPSFAHFVIVTMFNIMFQWLELAKKLENDNQVIDTIKCLGACTNLVCEAQNAKLSPMFKQRKIETIIKIYCEYKHYPENIACVTSRKWLLKMFLNPTNVDWGKPVKTTEMLNYKDNLKQAWNDFDKVPYTSFHGNKTVLTDFENNVLAALGIT